MTSNTSKDNNLEFSAANYFENKFISHKNVGKL
jgi:hypothetical protein